MEYRRESPVRIRRSASCRDAMWRPVGWTHPALRKEDDEDRDHRHGAVGSLAVVAGTSLVGPVLRRPGTIPRIIRSTWPPDEAFAHVRADWNVAGRDRDHAAGDLMTPPSSRRSDHGRSGGDRPRMRIMADRRDGWDRPPSSPVSKSRFPVESGIPPSPRGGFRRKVSRRWLRPRTITPFARTECTTVKGG